MPPRTRRQGALAFPKIAAVVVAIACLILAGSQATRADSLDYPVTVQPQLGHFGDVLSLAYSPDGRVIASGGDDGTIVLWEASSGRELRTLKGHGRNVKSVAFSPNGNTLVSGSGDHTIKLWDAASGRELHTFKGHADRVNAVAFSPDGRTIASASDDGAVKLWDVSTGRERQSFSTRSREVTSVAFSPDGRMIASGAGNGKIDLWEVSGGRPLLNMDADGEFVYSIAFSTDGRAIASASNGSVKLWDASNGRLSLTLKGPAEAVAFSPDGRTFASGSGLAGLKIWDVSSGRPVRTLTADFNWSLAFSPDGRTIASGSPQYAIKVWDVGDGRELRSLSGRSDDVKAALFSPDGRVIASAGNGDGSTTIKLWDASNGRRLQTMSGASSLWSVAFSPDGRAIAAAEGEDQEPAGVELWDTASGRKLRTLKSTQSQTLSVAFSPDGRTIAAGGFDGSGGNSIVLWNSATGRELRALKAPARTPSMIPVVFSPDGRTIASASDARSITLWDAGTGRKLRAWEAGDGPMEPNTSYVGALAFSPDGRIVAAETSDQSIKLWDAASGRELRTLAGNSGYALAAAFSPDGRMIAAGSDDNTVDLWDVSTGRELRILSGHVGRVDSVSFSADGRTILSGSQDGTVKLWDLDGHLLLTEIAFSGGEWVALTPEGFFDASTHGAQQLTVVRGLEAYSIDQVKQELYRPDLVRDKLAGDPNGRVAAAAAKLDLTKVIGSGSPPDVAITSPADRSTIGQAEKTTVDVTLTDRGGGVGRVEWRVNGVTQGVVARGLFPLGDAEPPSPGQPGPRRIALKRTLELDPGESRIEVVAYNARNLVASEPAAIVLRRDAPIAANLTKPKLHVVAVGINEYWDSRLRLSYAAPDATAIAEGFRKAGAKLYSEVDVATVLNADATIAHLDRVFADLAKRVASRDVFVLFLAGHGKTIEGRYYFIPQDFHYRGEDSIEQQGLDQKQLQSWLAEIPAKKSVLLFDTCESGSMTGANSAVRGLGDLEAVQRMIWATGRTTLTASTDDAPAQEGYRGHGVFTYAVLAALGEAPTDKDGLIEVTALAHFVDQAVPEISQTEFHWRQVPQMSIVGSDFPLAARVSVLDDAAVFASAAPQKPTHVVISSADVYPEPGGVGTATARLAPGTQVRLVETRDGWTLVARDGAKIGYVNAKALAGLQ